MMSLSFFVVPAIVVSLGSILGVIYPYRLRGWQFRWAHRKNLRMSAHWVLLCFGPGWVLGTVLMSLMFPSIFLSDALARLLNPGVDPRDVAFWPLLFSLILWAQGAISLWVFPVSYTHLCQVFFLRLLLRAAPPAAGLDWTPD